METVETVVTGWLATRDTNLCQEGIEKLGQRYEKYWTCGMTTEV